MPPSLHRRSLIAGAAAVATSVGASGALLGGTVGTAHAAPGRLVHNPLATAENRAAERAAQALLADPALQDLIPAVAESWRASVTARVGPISAGSDAALLPAVRELAFSAAQRAVNDDPRRPIVTTFLGPPHRWFGNRVPGGRFGIDNADTIYRGIPVDGESSYVIRGRMFRGGPVTLNFFLVKSIVTQDPITFLDGPDLVVAPDGAFTITLDPRPASGRPNHIQTTPETGHLMVRDTVADWGRETPTALVVERVAGPKPGPRATRAQLVERAVEILDTNGAGLVDRFLLPAVLRPPVNTLPAPLPPGSFPGLAPTQSQTFGHFRLGDGEGLLVTVDPAGASYFNVPVTSLWMVSPRWWEHQSSLNSAQAVPNADGTYTFVVSGSDPGIRNWVDTAGLAEGTVFVRWQGLPTGSTPGITASSVSLSDVPTDLLPASPADRGAQLAARRAGYDRRYARFV